MPPTSRSGRYVGGGAYGGPGKSSVSNPARGVPVMQPVHGPHSSRKPARENRKSTSSNGGGGGRSPSPTVMPTPQPVPGPAPSPGPVKPPQPPQQDIQKPGKQQVAKMGIGGGLGNIFGGLMDMAQGRSQGFSPIGSAQGFDLGQPGPGLYPPYGGAAPGIPFLQGPDFTPYTHGLPSKQWVANGAVFQQNSDGTISVRKKNGQIKTYRPYKPVVFGKKLDASKFAKLAKKYRGIYKELHKIFGKKTSRKPYIVKGGPGDEVIKL